MKASILFREQPLRGPGRLGDAGAGVVRDSRQMRPHQLFVAIGVDAKTNAEAAVAAGAAVVITEQPLGTSTEWLTPHARWSFARAHAASTGIDELTVPVVAVTGTKGKTTTAWAAWWALGLGAARVGTVGWHDGITEHTAQQTTPPPEELHAFLAGCARNCPGVAIEASSHAGDQHRLAGISFAGLAVTGIGRDHLDYHRTMAAYVAAKMELVHQLGVGKTLIVNADDERAATFMHAGHAVGARVLSLGFNRGEARLRQHGATWRLHVLDGDLIVPCALPGAFNAWNMAAGALLAEAAGVALPTALARLDSMPAVPGRLELCGTQPLTYVDYAHTAESLTQVCIALRQRHPGQRLVLVFGCGGDRDPGKRGPMGQAALAADVGIVTTDNPRSENPATIAAAVIAGGDKRLLVELDRRAAIRQARDLAGVDGVVVVCGKGHETEQIIGSARLQFDDRAEVRALVAKQAAKQPGMPP